ncbi:MAG: hypothetical protein WA061_01730 [Microgenomates group bacterium]
MTITDSLNETFKLARELGIDGYFDNLSDEEIIDMALYQLRNYLEENIDGIKEDMEIFDGDGNLLEDF